MFHISKSNTEATSRLSQIKKEYAKDHYTHTRVVFISGIKILFGTI